MAGIPQQGYNGVLLLGFDQPVPSAGVTTAILGLKTMNMRENIAKHDLTCTTSPKIESPNNPTVTIVKVPVLNGKSSINLSVSAIYGANGSGDPPQLGNNAIYGNVFVAASYAGDQIQGYFLIENYANVFDESGMITYNLDMVSNGQYTRVSNAPGTYPLPQ